MSRTATGRKGASAQVTTKVQLRGTVSARAAKRFGAACLEHDLTAGELLEKLINDNLKAYSIKVDGKRIVEPDDSPGESGPLESPALSAA